MIRLRPIAWAALLATLFSAASPTLAAWVLSSTPAALGQMLRIPATAFDAHLPQHHDGLGASGADHADHSSDARHEDGSHQSHSVHCSLCLNPSSLATVAPLPPSLWLLGLEFDIVEPQPQANPSAPSYPLYRSRAPPA
jgi:hypothetical protein